MKAAKVFAMERCVMTASKYSDTMAVPSDALKEIPPTPRHYPGCCDLTRQASASAAAICEGNAIEAPESQYPRAILVLGIFDAYIPQGFF